MKLSVIGTGYVGLVTGTCFAENGNTVTCVDIDEAKIAALRQGQCPIYEPDLDTLLERNIRHERLFFTTDLATGIRDAAIIFLALPTPPGEDGSADLSYILGVAHKLAELITDYKIIVNKSTVPVGTAEKVQAIFDEKCSAKVDVVSNPEFLREGCAVEDFMKPDRVVIGAHTPAAKELMGKLYEPFVRQGNPVYFMDPRSAEVTKYAANAYLATRITFMNELANLCEKVGANVDKVRVGMGSDSRIGKRFLFPGVGYGGSCFPKDVMALSRTAGQYQYDFKILDAVIRTNDKQKTLLAEKLRGFFGNHLEGMKIAIWGLAFKPNTDDIREAPALYIIEDLLRAGASIAAFDPEAMPNTERIFGDRISFGQNEYEVLDGADALLIITEWSEFRVPDFDKVTARMKRRVIFDGRNVLQPEDMEKLGFYYNSIGRRTVFPV